MAAGWRRSAVRRSMGSEDDVNSAGKSGTQGLLGAWALAMGLFAVSPECAALDVIAAQTLARQSGCLQCHGVYQKKSGPPWKEVAAYYHGEKGAEERLYRHLTTGRKARFDDGHEESHPIVKTSDPDRIANLVNWILSLRSQSP
jgi:cytochrome c